MNTKWLFIHIPKTGGTFFREATELNEIQNEAHAFPYRFKVNLWDPSSPFFARNLELKNRWYNRHYSPKYVREKDGIDYVTIVRNPFDLFYSYWKMHNHNTLPENPVGWANCNNIMQTTTFHDFVEYYLDPKKEWHIPPLKKNLFAQIYTKSGKLIPNVGNILRFENLENDMETWCKNNGIKCISGDALLYVNKNTNPNKDTFKGKYTALQIYKLEQLWQKQLETFNYKHSD
tara:strand:+ start:904 stop:1599 length:696 start_codon:yes stop_codon:yes gene_type:complete